MKICVFTLGCKVNSSESDSLIRALRERGHDVVEGLQTAELYIVNTCAVTAEAEKKSRQTAARIGKLNPNARIIYTGCACEKNPEGFSVKEGASLVTGVFGKSEIPDMLGDSGVIIRPQTKIFEELLPVDTARARSYVKVQDGCDNFCSYCIIPYLRGRSRSRATEKVLEEVNAVDSLEIVINGINLSSYNYNGAGLDGLITALGGVKKRIRLGSLEVGVITERLLVALGGLKDFAPHFHLSLQSGSDKVLKDMNRHYTAAEYLGKIRLIREYFPNAGITTDIIAAYPTETDADFENTLSLVAQAEFSDIHCFIYSPRSGTRAYALKQLPPEVGKARIGRLLEVKAARRAAFEQSNVGVNAEVLVEGFKDGYSVGYTGNYIRAYIKGKLPVGMTKCTLIESFRDGMIATR